jgi:hypothetical protein
VSAPRDPLVAPFRARERKAQTSATTRPQTATVPSWRRRLVPSASQAGAGVPALVPATRFSYVGAIKQNSRRISSCMRWASWPHPTIGRPFRRDGSDDPLDPLLARLMDSFHDVLGSNPLDRRIRSDDRAIRRSMMLCLEPSRLPPRVRHSVFPTSSAGVTLSPLASASSSSYRGSASPASTRPMRRGDTMPRGVLPLRKIARAHPALLAQPADPLPKRGQYLLGFIGAHVPLRRHGRAGVDARPTRFLGCGQSRAELVYDLKADPKRGRHKRRRNAARRASRPTVSGLYLGAEARYHRRLRRISIRCRTWV